MGCLNIQFQHFLRCLKDFVCFRKDRDNGCGDGNSRALSGLTCPMGFEGGAWDQNGIYIKQNVLETKNDSLKSLCVLVSM